MPSRNLLISFLNAVLVLQVTSQAFVCCLTTRLPSLTASMPQSLLKTACGKTSGRTHACRLSKDLCNMFLISSKIKIRHQVYQNHALSLE